MRINNSTVSMSAVRSYEAKATESTTTINRYYGSGLEKATATTRTADVSYFEVEGGTALFQTSGDGISRSDEGVVDYKNKESKPTGQESSVQGTGGVTIAVPNTGNWIFNINNNSEIQLLKRLLALLEQFTGKKSSRNSYDIPTADTAQINNSFQLSASSASMRYQQTMAMFQGQGQVSAANTGSQSSGVNGQWTRQTIQSGFVAGAEHTAFSSRGTVVTSDGRTIDFGISVEMSRSFAAAYEITGKEEIYTDPLVINLDTDATSLSDVSFYFDLDGDGTAEEISALDSSSGFLALDKNGDGVINDGSELFGAQTGDGFSELAQYDQDGNGWIDENDDIFSRLSVWVKCGTEDAKLLSLAEAGVGAIFLGSQSTQYALTDSSGAENGVIRRSGIYLKASGEVGTVQHVDFRT